MWALNFGLLLSRSYVIVFVCLHLTRAFLCHRSLPDISLATGLLSQYASEHAPVTLKSMKRVLGHLKAAESYGTKLDLLSKLDWQIWVSIVLYEEFFLWKCRKKSYILLSNVEADFEACSATTCKIKMDTTVPSQTRIRGDRSSRNSGNAAPESWGSSGKSVNVACIITWDTALLSMKLTVIMLWWISSTSIKFLKYFFLQIRSVNKKKRFTAFLDMIDGQVCDWNARCWQGGVESCVNI